MDWVLNFTDLIHLFESFIIKENDKNNLFLKNNLTRWFLTFSWRWHLSCSSP